MDFFIHIKAIRMGLSILYLKGSQVGITNHGVFLSLRIDFTVANSVGPDEMPHYVAFHLGLHGLSEYPFRGFQYTKG